MSGAQRARRRRELIEQNESQAAMLRNFEQLLKVAERDLAMARAAAGRTPDVGAEEAELRGLRAERESLKAMMLEARAETEVQKILADELAALYGEMMNLIAKADTTPAQSKEAPVDVLRRLLKRLADLEEESEEGRAS